MSFQECTRYKSNGFLSTSKPTFPFTNFVEKNLEKWDQLYCESSGSFFRTPSFRDRIRRHTHHMTNHSHPSLEYRREVWIRSTSADITRGDLNIFAILSAQTSYYCAVAYSEYWQIGAMNESWFSLVLGRKESMEAKEGRFVDDEKVERLSRLQCVASIPNSNLRRSW